jgi:hypothetical protein
MDICTVLLCPLDQVVSKLYLIILMGHFFCPNKSGFQIGILCSLVEIGSGLAWFSILEYTNTYTNLQDYNLSLVLYRGHRLVIHS